MLQKFSPAASRLKSENLAKITCTVSIIPISANLLLRAAWYGLSKMMPSTSSLPPVGKSPLYKCVSPLCLRGIVVHRSVADLLVLTVYNVIIWVPIGSDWAAGDVATAAAKTWTKEQSNKGAERRRAGGEESERRICRKACFIFHMTIYSMRYEHGNTVTHWSFSGSGRLTCTHHRDVTILHFEITVTEKLWLSTLRRESENFSKPSQMFISHETIHFTFSYLYASTENLMNIRPM